MRRDRKVHESIETQDIDPDTTEGEGHVHTLLNLLNKLRKRDKM